MHAPARWRGTDQGGAGDHGYLYFSSAVLGQNFIISMNFLTAIQQYALIGQDNSRGIRQSIYGSGSVQLVNRLASIAGILTGIPLCHSQYCFAARCRIVIQKGQLDLRKFVAPEFVCGHGALQLAGRYARNFGMKQVLLVTDPGVRAAGWADAVGESLTEAGIPFTIFDSLSPNPRSGQVMAGVEIYRSEECNGIVAVGGGSPMDCAKGIGIAGSNMQDILTFEGADRVPVPASPLICIPTTAGSSADVSQFAIITDEERKRKIAIISKTLVPDISLLDPEPLTTMPRELTVDAGMDALCHAIEAYVSNASSPMTDLHALEAIRLIHTALPAVIDAPEDLNLRFSTLLASLHAGLAFSNASLGAAHAMAHSLGGTLDLPHGRCNALLLEHVISANYEAAPDRYDRIRAIIGRGQDEKTTLAEMVAAFRRTLGITETLAAAGVSEDGIRTLAAKAYADPCLVTNPRRLTCEDIERIYEYAL